MVFCSSEFRKGILHHCRLWIWHLFNKKYFSRTSATHIPISCVPNEETASSKVSAICVGNKVAYMADMGRKVIFRVDTTTGSCTSFGTDILGNTFILFSVFRESTWYHHLGRLRVCVRFRQHLHFYANGNPGQEMPHQHTWPANHPENTWNSFAYHKVGLYWHPK